MLNKKFAKNFRKALKALLLSVNSNLLNVLTNALIARQNKTHHIVSVDKPRVTLIKVYKQED